MTLVIRPLFFCVFHLLHLHSLWAGHDHYSLGTSVFSPQESMRPWEEVCKGSGTDFQCQTPDKPLPDSSLKFPGRRNARLWALNIITRPSRRLANVVPSLSLLVSSYDTWTRTISLHRYLSFQPFSFTSLYFHKKGFAIKNFVVQSYDAWIRPLCYILLLLPAPFSFVFPYLHK